MVHQGFQEAFRLFLQLTKRKRQDLRKKLSISSIDEIETFNEKHNRVVNKQDLVPKLDRISRFHHLGEEILLASNDGEGHGCDGYIDNLIDLV